MGSISPNQLSRWFDAYGPSLVLFARQWLFGPSAEDAVQDVFVRLMAQRTAPTSVTAWDGAARKAAKAQPSASDFILII